MYAFLYLGDLPTIILFFIKSCGLTDKKVFSTFIFIPHICENHLDELKTHLTSNGVESSLVEGMAKSMRSKAARQLMTKTMNNYAAQAAAMANAEKLKEQSANE